MKYLPLRQAKLVLLASTALLASSALSAEFTVTTPTTAQNGGAANILDGNDTLIITQNGSITQNTFPAVTGTGTSNTVKNAGTITTTGGALAGIFIADSNTINNTGTITTDGDFSHAIFVQDGNTVINAGTIITNSTNSIGIVGQNNNNFSNSGTITVLGNSSTGMAGLNNNIVTNSGTINASGSNSNAMAAFGTDSTFTNSGMIVVNGTNGFGIAAATNTNTLINTGTIITNGFGGAGMGSGGGNFLTVTNSGDIITNGNAHGMIALNDSNFNNSGTIFVSGANAVGMFGTTGNIFAHSGKITSTQNAAIQFTGSDNQLNLLAPAYIGGAVEMGANNAVNITTGRSHSNSWYFAGTPTMSFDGPVPWAWDVATKQFATLDPTALSAAPDLLATMVGTLSNMSRYKTSGEWWLQGYGNFTGQAATGIYNNYTDLNGGIAAGTSTTLNDYMELGAFIGYQASNLNVGSQWVTSQTIAGNGMVGGLRGSAKMDAWFVEFALYAGGQANTSDRFVNDNLQNLGEDHAVADFNSWFLAPEIRVGVNLEGTGEWTLTPSASARFSSQWIDGYTETGSNTNATVAARVVQVFEGDIELAAMRKIDNGTLSVKGGLSFRQNLGAATQDIILLGQTLALPMNVNGNLGGYVGVESTYDLTQNSILNLTALASYGAGNTVSISGSVGFNSKF